MAIEEVASPGQVGDIGVLPYWTSATHMEHICSL